MDEMRLGLLLFKLGPVLGRVLSQIGETSEPDLRILRDL